MVPRIAKMAASNTVKTPSIGEPYYCIGQRLGEFKVIKSTFMDDAVDQSRLASHNMFYKETDAEIALSKINNIFIQVGEKS